MLGILFKDLSTNVNFGADVDSNKSEVMVMLICLIQALSNNSIVM